jgi:hypothetical protein
MATPQAKGDAGKKLKSAVGYKLGGDHCGVCRHFIEAKDDGETGSCELVAGEIGEDMWCRLFKREMRTLAEGSYK